MKKTYRVAIIGCGEIAGGYDEKSAFRHVYTHAGAYKKHPRFILTAVADNDKARLSKFQEIWKVKKGYTDYLELLKKEKIDLLSVCVPDRLHFKIIRDSLRRGSMKAILGEKPMADELDDARQLLKLCNRAKVSLFINYNRLWEPAHRAVKTMIENGCLGDLQSCLGYYVRGIRHNGSTMISTIKFLLGDDINKVRALAKSSSGYCDDPAIDGVLTSKSGVNIFLIASDKNGYGHSIFEIDLLGNKGRAKIVDNGHNVELYKTAVYKRYAGVRELVPISKKGLKSFPKNGMGETLLYTLDEIALSLDRGLLNLGYAYEAVKDMRIAEALIESVNGKGKVVCLN